MDGDSSSSLGGTMASLRKAASDGWRRVRIASAAPLSLVKNVSKPSNRRPSALHAYDTR